MRTGERADVARSKIQSFSPSLPSAFYTSMWASSGTPSTASIRSRSSKSSPTEASKPSTGLDAGVPRRVDRGHRHPARGATDGRRPRGSGHMTRLHDKTTQVVALGATPVSATRSTSKGSSMRSRPSLRILSCTSSPIFPTTATRSPATPSATTGSVRKGRAIS